MPISKPMSHYEPNAFTIIEVLVGIVVLTVLLVFSLPRFTIFLERMRAQEGAQVLQAVLGAQKRFELQEGTPANNISSLDFTLSNLENFENPTLLTTPGGGARITRSLANQNNYTLEIDASGTITCTGGNICGKIGY